MKMAVRGAAASLMIVAMSAAMPAISQQSASVVVNKEKSALSNEREKVSYAVGLDVGHSFEPVAQDIDLDAMQAAIENAFKGGKPVLSEQEARATNAALQAAAAARSGKQMPGGAPGSSPAVSKIKAGQLAGGYMVGPSLARLKDDIDLPVLMQAIRTVFGKGTALLDQQQAASVMQAFISGKQATAANKNRAEGNAFLSKNKAQKGVITTSSGLQYMVLRQGSGERPTPASKVRVNYEGRLLDGTVFDSSYQRGQPVEFGLNQVIQGWSEGVSLMPVGSKYRFWVPSNLAYGPAGTQGGPIGPEATLTFDVELMGILP